MNEFYPTSAEPYVCLSQNDVTPLKLASVVNNYDVMRLLMNHGGRLSTAAAGDDDDAATTLDHEGGRDGQLSRIAYMVPVVSFAFRYKVLYNFWRRLA